MEAERERDVRACARLTDDEVMSEDDHGSAGDRRQTLQSFRLETNRLGFKHPQIVQIITM